jgi:hypothetical protein
LFFSNLRTLKKWKIPFFGLGIIHFCKVLLIYYIIPLSPYWMVLHSVTLWTGAWESGSGWGLGVPNHFGGPWAITLCNTPKNLPTLVLAPSLFPHSLNSLSLRSHGGLHSGLRTRVPTSLKWNSARGGAFKYKDQILNFLYGKCKCQFVAVTCIWFWRGIMKVFSVPCKYTRKFLKMLYVI